MGVLGPNKASTSIDGSLAFLTFSELVAHAQYEMPSTFSKRSLKEVGLAGGIKVGVGEGVGVAIDGDGDGEGAGTGAGAGTLAGAALTTTPLSQTSALPFLTQVYFFPETVEICPAFLQTEPGLTAA